MNAKEAIKTTLIKSHEMLKNYLQDLSDADLQVRPVPNANHIAWQLGHLITSERHMMSQQFPGHPFPELPAGFAETHHKDNAKVDPPKGFATKDQYLDLFKKIRRATLDAVEKMPEKDLDKPTVGKMAEFFPTLGALLLLPGSHVMMHAGQFTVVRRKLGKPEWF
jgi:hypothetical protein